MRVAALALLLLGGCALPEMPWPDTRGPGVSWSDRLRHHAYAHCNVIVKPPAAALRRAITAAPGTPWTICMEPGWYHLESDLLVAKSNLTITGLLHEGGEGPRATFDVDGPRFVVARGTRDLIFSNMLYTAPR